MTSIAFRVAVESDHSFIYNSWLRSFRNSPYARCIPNEEYYEKQGKLITHLLSTGVTLLAVDPEDTNIIWGYVNYTLPTINYVYTKFVFRKLGVAKNLVGAAVDLTGRVEVSHITHHINESRIIFNPKELSKHYA